MVRGTGSPRPGVKGGLRGYRSAAIAEPSARVGCAPLRHVCARGMIAKLFEAALGIASPWSINGVEFDIAKQTLSIGVDFIAGSRSAVLGVEGAHPAHNTVPKSDRHRNFFQHDCHLEVRVPRVRLPDGGIWRSNRTRSDGWSACPSTTQKDQMRSALEAKDWKIEHIA
jgi:hypothetical protein